MPAAAFFESTCTVFYVWSMTSPGNPSEYCTYMFSPNEPLGSCGQKGIEGKFLKIASQALAASLNGTLPIPVASKSNFFKVYPYYFRVLPPGHHRACPGTKHQLLNFSGPVARSSCDAPRPKRVYNIVINKTRIYVPP